MAAFRWPRRGTSQSQAGLREGFRSGLEEKNAAHLKTLLGHDPDFESIKLRYTIPATFHNYTPDFPLPNGIIVETKGRFVAADRRKHLYVRAAHPDKDIRFVFSNAKAKLTKLGKTTYADWCDKHGFKWAEKLIPEEWINEPGRAAPR